LKASDSSPANRPFVGGVRRADAIIYALPLALVAIVVALRSLLTPMLDGQALYLLLLLPVLIAGVLGGMGPGLLTTAAGLIFHLYVTGGLANLVDTGSPLFAVELWHAATFAGLGVAMAWTGERLQRTRRQAAAREVHLQSILDTVPEAMIVIDERGVMQSFSSAAERLSPFAP
jgi:two-component system, LuxR family, sensor kinase FixL